MKHIEHATLTKHVCYLCRKEDEHRRTLKIEGDMVKIPYKVEDKEGVQIENMHFIVNHSFICLDCRSDNKTTLAGCSGLRAINV